MSAGATSGTPDVTGAVPAGDRRPWSLRELVDDLRAGRTTARDAHRRARQRIAETEKRIHAWVEDPSAGEHPDDAASVRVGTEAAGALLGAPLGVKDIIDVRGLPTRCGTALRADAGPSPSDAAIVSAWRAAGAVPIGKTVTTEFAFFAPGPTDNPAAPGHTPGGSSSGSAAAVAAGQVPLALGSQTAGSVTRPAAYCGTAALVMTHGRYPMDGVTGLSPSLDSHGIYAANVSDLALAWSALTGNPDPAITPLRPPRLLLWTAQGLGVLEPEMTDALERARHSLVAAGATVDTFGPEQLIAETTAAHPVLMGYEAARERAGELGRADELSAPLANLLRTGAQTSERDVRAARAVIVSARGQILDLLGRYDAVLGPAAPGVAPAGLAATGDPVLSRAWQAIGLPALSVPGLFSPAGLPLGLQLLGRPDAESALLMVGVAVQAALNA